MVGLNEPNSQSIAMACSCQEDYEFIVFSETNSQSSADGFEITLPVMSTLPGLTRRQECVAK